MKPFTEVGLALGVRYLYRRSKKETDVKMCPDSLKQHLFQQVYGGDVFPFGEECGDPDEMS